MNRRTVRRTPHGWTYAALAAGMSAMVASSSGAQGTADSGAKPPLPSTLPIEPAHGTKPVTPEIPLGSGASSAVSDADADAKRAERELELRRKLIPEPFSGAVLDGIPAALALDEGARKRFADARTAYDAAQRDARREDPRRIATLIPAAYRFDPVAKDFVPVHTPELLAAMRLRDQLVARLAESETALFKSIDELCPSDKRAAWRAIRNERAQQLFGHPARLPAASVNLLELVPRAGLSEPELAALEPFLDRYAREYLDALRQRHDRLLEIERDGAETLVALGPEWRAGRTESEALEVDRGLAQLELGHTLADTGLRTLNNNSITTLKSQLLPVSWRKVVEAYRRVVHPEIYEDERAFRLLTEDMLGLPGIEPTRIGAVVETLGLLEDRLRPLGQQAAELADGIIAADALAATDAAAARILLQSKLQSVLEKRRRAIRESIQLLRGIAPPNDAAFAARLEDELQSLAALDRAGRFIKDGLDARASELAVIRAMGETSAESTHESTPGVGAPEPQTQPTGTPDASAPPSEQVPAPRGGRGSRSR